MKEKFIDSKWHFTIVENVVIEDERLLPSEKLVYIVLSKFASQERCCFPSLSTISKLSGYSKSTVVRAINRLGHLGYLRKERRKDEVRGNISTFYTLTLPEDTLLPNAPLPEEAPEESTPEEEELLARPGTLVVPAFGEDDHMLEGFTGRVLGRKPQKPPPAATGSPKARRNPAGRG